VAGRIATPVPAIEDSEYRAAATARNVHTRKLALRAAAWMKRPAAFAAEPVHSRLMAELIIEADPQNIVGKRVRCGCQND
jgi:hypothetical protein